MAALAESDCSSASLVTMCTEFWKLQRLFSERTSFALAAPAWIDIGPCFTITLPENSSVSVRKSEVTSSASQLNVSPGRTRSAALALVPSTASSSALAARARLLRFEAATHRLQPDVFTVQIRTKVLHHHRVSTKAHVHGRCNAVRDIGLRVDRQRIGAQERLRLRIRRPQHHVAEKLHDVEIGGHEALACVEQPFALRRLARLRLKVVHAHRIQRDAVVAALLDAIRDQAHADRTVRLRLCDDRVLQVIAGLLRLRVVGSRRWAALDERA